MSLHICSPSHTEAPTEQSRRGIVKGNKNVVFFQPPNTSQQPFTTTPLLTMTNEKVSSMYPEYKKTTANNIELK